MPVCDTILRLAKTDLFRVVWGSEILVEVARNLPKLGLTSDQIDYRIGEMTKAFPDALVDGWDTMLLSVPAGVDEKDRHVVATALRARAHVIVSKDIDDMPRDALATIDLLIQPPDEFLVNQWDKSPRAVGRSVADQVARLTKFKPRTMDEHIEFMAHECPEFAQRLRDHPELLVLPT